MDFVNPYVVLDIPVLELLRNLSIGLVVAVIWAFFLGRSTRLIIDTSQYLPVFIILIPTMILIITVIKSSIALSLGLVGALSIVRFRTPIKEPEELLYIFVAIAVGLGLGANQVVPTLIGFFVVLIALLPLMLTQKKHGYSSSKWSLLEISLDESGDNANPVEDIIASLETLNLQHRVKRVETGEEHSSVVVEVKAFDPKTIDAIKQELKDSNRAVLVSLYDTARIIT